MFEVKTMTFKVLILQDEDGRFNASCPELEGCFSFGNSVEEAKKNIREAIELYLRDMPEEEISSIRLKVEVAEVTI
jgi:predicted RNase H-like HicB family nuclease